MWLTKIKSDSITLSQPVAQMSSLSDVIWLLMNVNFYAYLGEKNWYYSMLSNYNTTRAPSATPRFHLIPTVTAKMSPSPSPLLPFHQPSQRSTTSHHAISAMKRITLHFVEFELGRWWSHRGNNLNIYWFCDIPEPSQAGMLTHPSVTSSGLEGWAFWRSFSRLWMRDSTAVVWYWGQ